MTGPAAFLATFLACLVAIGLAFAIWLASSGAARAHEAPSGWVYPLQCCSNRDCTEIPASRVKEAPDGYHVTLVPGDHDFIKAQTSFLVPYQSAKSAPDGAYHICISPDLRVLCFFAGEKSF